jgi:hypothetical protein
MKKKSEHYVNNKEFLKEMIEWKKQYRKSIRQKTNPPPITNYIGECFMSIAENLIRRPNFVNYPFKEDMIGDAIENCITYCYNFDSKKSENPFAYFTQIIYYAFLRRIQKEKKQNIIKYKYLKHLDTKGDFNEILKGMNLPEEEIEKIKEITEVDVKKPRKKRRKKI